MKRFGGNGIPAEEEFPLRQPWSSRGNAQLMAGKGRGGNGEATFFPAGNHRLRHCMEQNPVISVGTPAELPTEWFPGFPRGRGSEQTIGVHDVQSIRFPPNRQFRGNRTPAEFRVSQSVEEFHRVETGDVAAVAHVEGIGVIPAGNQSTHFPAVSRQQCEAAEIEREVSRGIHDGDRQCVRDGEFPRGELEMEPAWHRISRGPIRLRGSWREIPAVKFASIEQHDDFPAGIQFQFEKRR